MFRHNLDVMQIEKNEFDNIMDTIFNVTGKLRTTLQQKSCFETDISAFNPFLIALNNGLNPFLNFGFKFYIIL